MEPLTPEQIAHIQNLLNELKKQLDSYYSTGSAGNSSNDKNSLGTMHHVTTSPLYNIRLIKKKLIAIENDIGQRLRLCGCDLQQLKHDSQLGHKITSFAKYYQATSHVIQDDRQKLTALFYKVRRALAATKKVLSDTMGYAPKQQDLEEITAAINTVSSNHESNYFPSSVTHETIQYLDKNRSPRNPFGIEHALESDSKTNTPELLPENPNPKNDFYQKTFYARQSNYADQFLPGKNRSPNGTYSFS